MEPKTNVKTELQVKKRQYKEKFIFQGIIRPKPNQRVFRCEVSSGEVSECKFTNVSDTVNYLEVLNNTYKLRERNIVVEEGFDYVVRLNITNAVRHFKKKYGNYIFAGDLEDNRLFANQRNINIFKKT